MPWLQAGCAFRRRRTLYRPRAGTLLTLISDPLFYYLPCYLLLHAAAQIINGRGGVTDLVYYDGLEARPANYSVKALVQLQGPQNTTYPLVLDRI